MRAIEQPTAVRDFYITKCNENHCCLINLAHRLYLHTLIIYTAFLFLSKLYLMWKCDYTLVIRKILLYEKNTFVMIK